MNGKKAIVTLVIGERYERLFGKFAKPTWELYAKKHGYDLIIIDAPLDSSERARGRSVAWQKCLILSQSFSKKYDQIAWVDSDILINPGAPPIFEGVPQHLVGAVDEWSTPTFELYRVSLERAFEYWGSTAVINRSPQEYYLNRGLKGCFDKVVQTGVLVLSPDNHKEILEKTYYQYEDKGGAQWNYEMPPLSYELLKSGMVHWIDNRFNAVWINQKFLNYPFLVSKSTWHRLFDRLLNKLPVEMACLWPYARLFRACATTSFLNNYFLHFAGAMAEMGYVDARINSCERVKT